MRKYRQHIPVEEMPQKMTCEYRGCEIKPGDQYYATNEDNPIFICTDCARDLAWAHFQDGTTLKTAQERED